MVDRNVAYGTTPSYDGETPTKAATAQYTYTFNGWTPEVSPVTGNVTYTAQFTSMVNKYTVVWKNGNEVLETDTDVEYGATPSYDGAAPTKAATAQYTYTFAGWNPEISPVTGNATYTAVFTSTVNKYTVTWKNGDEVLETDRDVAYGATPSYNGATPVKAEDDDHFYTFSGWTPEIDTVTGDATYTAVYSTYAAVICPSVSITGWTYGQYDASVNAPVVSDNPSSGKVTYTYAKKGTNEYTEAVPTDAGLYTVKASVAETTKYHAAEATADFEITKALLTVTALNQTVSYGSPIDRSKYVVKGLVDGDSISVTLSQSIAKNTITPSVTASDNYDVTRIAGILGLIDMPNAWAIPNGSRINISWCGIQKADGYLVYAAYRGEIGYELAGDIAGNYTSFNLTKLHGKALDTSKNVMILVYAYQNVNGKQVKIVKSSTLYVAGASSRNTNAKIVNVNSNAIALSVGQTTKITTAVTLVNSNLSELKYAAALRYATSHSNIAAVDANGNIKAVGKGTANIYVYTQNGCRAKITVTVK